MAAVTSGANDQLGIAKQEDEQGTRPTRAGRVLVLGLRAAVRDQSDRDLRAYEPPNAEKARSCLTPCSQVFVKDYRANYSYYVVNRIKQTNPKPVALHGFKVTGTTDSIGFSSDSTLLL